MPGFGKSGIARICSLKSIAARHRWAARLAVAGYGFSVVGEPPRPGVTGPCPPSTMAPPATIVVSRGGGRADPPPPGIGWSAAPPNSTAGCRRSICRRRAGDVDLAGVERLDTAGAWLLLRTEHGPPPAATGWPREICKRALPRCSISSVRGAAGCRLLPRSDPAASYAGRLCRANCGDSVNYLAPRLLVSSASAVSSSP